MKNFSINISLPTTFSLQEILIAAALVLLLIIVISITIGRRRPRRRRRRGGARANVVVPRSRTTAKHDHGAEVAIHHGVARSPQWGRVERTHLLNEPACVVCGYLGKGVQVHHIKPFHLHPNLELDPRNLITLCEVTGRDHHLLIGHLDDWESFNVNVREDAKYYHKKNAAQIRANPRWLKEVAKRP